MNSTIQSSARADRDWNQNDRNKKGRGSKARLHVRWKKLLDKIAAQEAYNTRHEMKTVINSILGNVWSRSIAREPHQE